MPSAVDDAKRRRTLAEEARAAANEMADPAEGESCSTLLMDTSALPRRGEARKKDRDSK